MNKRTSLLWLFVALSLGLWVFIIVNINFIALDIGRIAKRQPDESKYLATKELAIVDSALVAGSTEDLFFFNEKTSNPFRLCESGHSAGAQTTDTATPAVPRTALFLKGILMRGTPYALLTDVKGKSFICKIGDTLYTQKVMRIDKETVTLHDASGTYTLQRM
jgi:hypothetical protein